MRWIKYNSVGAVHKRRRQLGGGGGVKNWSRLPSDSTKKLPTWGRRVSKIRKKLPTSFMDGPVVFFWSHCADFCHAWTLDDAVNAQKVFQHMWPCVSNYLTIIINLSRKLLVSNYKSFLRFGKDSSLVQSRVVSVCNAWLKQAIQACPSACLPAACPTGHRRRREPQFLQSGRKELKVS